MGMGKRKKSVLTKAYSNRYFDMLTERPTRQTLILPDTTKVIKITMPSNTGYWDATEAAVNHDFSEALAEWMGWYLPKNQSIVDFGCGNGSYVAALDKTHYDVLGIEGDSSTIVEYKGCYVEQDLTEPFSIKTINGICLEVGEHIPPEYASQFIDNLTNNVQNILILSWAIPGQVGYGHVNCQTNQWVQKELYKRGFIMQLDDTLAARRAVEERFDYFRNTLMVFKKEQMSLDQLGVKYDTDKASHHHNYLGVYESYLAPYRYDPVSLIEIGVGGYKYPDRGGQSLRMWHDYFKDGKIIGIDVFDKEGIINNRTEFWKGSQTDKGLFEAILKREADAPVRVVIDDASHNNRMTIQTFENIFPMLTSGDLYFIEDVHTSYWQDEEFEGKAWPGEPVSTMWYFGHLTHQMNSEHFAEKHRNEFAGMIEFIHFYKEMIVIKKL